MNTHHRPEREGKYKIGDKVYCQGEDDKKKVLRKIIGITPSLGDLYRFNSKDGEIAYFEDEITPLAEDTPLEEIPHTKGFRSKEEIMELVESVEEDTAPEEWKDSREFDDAKDYLLEGHGDEWLKAFIRTLLQARDERALETLKKVERDWVHSPHAPEKGAEGLAFKTGWMCGIQEAITAIRGKSERREE